MAKAFEGTLKAQTELMQPLVTVRQWLNIFTAMSLLQRNITELAARMA